MTHATLLSYISPTAGVKSPTNRISPRKPANSLPTVSPSLPFITPHPEPTPPKKPSFLLPPRRLLQWIITCYSISKQMGCAFSSSSGLGALPPFSGVRVIHTNGYVEDFPGPGVVTVAHVTKSATATTTDGATPPRYVLCSSAHLLQPGRGPFRPDDALQPGTVYFLLPQSVFHAESSAVDLACLMNRLTALARKGCAANAPGPGPVEALFSARQEHDAAVVLADQKANKVSSSSSHKPWRPCLDRIDESIGRSSVRSASSRSACSEA